MNSASFPTTRFQGSKRSIIDWVWKHISSLEFDSILDPFGGTGAVSYRAKKEGKRVLYNDYLKFNHEIGKAIIENSSVKLTEEDIDYLLSEHPEIKYKTVIQDEFEGLYYTDKENAFLDMIKSNIQSLDNGYKRAIAYSTLFQAALAKRPYNLFHRANLYMRTDDVERSFGNKTTWDKSFEEHFREKVVEYNNAIFDNGKQNKSFNMNVLNWTNPPKTDVVYLDTPYYDRTKSQGGTDYQFYYHFLEGFLQYDRWPDMIDYSVKTNRLQHEPSPWTRKSEIKQAFETVFNLFSDRDIVLSYNTAGYPEPDELVDMLSEKKESVSIHAKEYQYALSKDKDSADEVIIVARD